VAMTHRDEIKLSQIWSVCKIVTIHKLRHRILGFVLVIWDKKKSQKKLSWINKILVVVAWPMRVGFGLRGLE